MRLFGLIGYPLGHSFSKQYFTEKFAREGIADARFELFPLEQIADLPALISSRPNLYGLSVTIPHKESVIPYLDELDDTARAIGAVNSIKIENGRMKGFNTDAIGFENALNAIDGGRWLAGGTEALVLGTGGASKATGYVLKKRGISVRFVSRRPAGDDQVSYASLRDRASLPALIVNTTPLGTWPDVEKCPDLPFERLGPKHLVFDLVYNPAETLLLRKAKAQGSTTKNGLEMLQLQAEASWRIWNS